MSRSNHASSPLWLVGLGLLAGLPTSQVAHAACPPPPQLDCTLGPAPNPAPDLSPLADDALSTWPVRARDEGEADCQGEEITAIWNSFGEYQDHWPHYGHTGIDIRSNPQGGGDLVVVAGDADVWAVATFNEDVCQHGYACRIYAKSYPSQDHIFYYAHLRLDPGSPVDQATRGAIIDAVSNDPLQGVTAGTRPLCEGRTLSQIGPFINQRSHLHFSIFDTADNYNGVNPLKVIQNPGIDQHDPVIEDVAFVTCNANTSQTSCQEVTVAEGCNYGTDPLTGTVDLLAHTRDVYQLDPDPVLAGGTESLGVYRADYQVRKIPDGNENDGTLFGGTFYEFDRLPFECRGEDISGCTDDPNNSPDIDDTKFLQLVDFPVTGPELGITFFGYFFSILGDFQSASPYGPNTTEFHYSIPTREWGLPGSWDTTQVPDGLYQVSVYVWDESGRSDTEDRFVVVKNDPGPLAIAGDIMIRDHAEDLGAVPSNANGEKHWRSTDIKVLPDGVQPPAAGSSSWDEWAPVELELGEDYNVYLRVENLGCEDATNVNGRVAFGTPSMWNGDWEEIGPQGGVDLGAPLVGGDAVVLGPFPWTPGIGDDGHKCLKAVLSADGDAASATLGEIEAGHVQGDNNIGQLNVKVFNEAPSMGFWFENPTPQPQPIALGIDATAFPLYEPGAVVELEVEYHAALAAAWAGVPHTTLVDDGVTLTLQIHEERVIMPAAVFPAQTVLDAEAELVLPAGVATGIYEVDFYEKVDGVVAGGMTVTAHNLIPQ